MFQQFALLKDLSEDQIKEILATNELYTKITQVDLSNLPEVNVNNFVNICNFVDYYQLIDDHEFLENIRFHILNKDQDIVNKITQLPINMIHKIYNHECIHNMQCFYDQNEDYDIKHISCYKFLSQNNDMPYCIEYASLDGHLELVKYLFKIGKDCTKKAIDLASVRGHLEIIKYLFEIKNKDCTTFAIDRASANGHLEVIKYLFEIAHKDCTTNAIDYACGKNHLDVVKYLFEVQHKDCTIYAMDYASQNGHLDVVKYLIEVQNIGYTKQTIDLVDFEKKYILDYFLTKSEFFYE